MSHLSEKKCYQKTVNSLFNLTGIPLKCIGWIYIKRIDISTHYSEMEITNFILDDCTRVWSMAENLHFIIVN